MKKYRKLNDMHMFSIISAIFWIVLSIATFNLIPLFIGIPLTIAAFFLEILQGNNIVNKYDDSKRIKK